MLVHDIVKTQMETIQDDHRSFSAAVERQRLRIALGLLNRLEIFLWAIKVQIHGGFCWWDESLNQEAQAGCVVFPLIVNLAGLGMMLAAPHALAELLHERKELLEGGGQLLTKKYERPRLHSP
jgi:hypothetical protein